jgi:hypothetical protein
MMFALFYVSVAIVAIVVLFRLLTYISKTKNDLTPLEVARRIERHLEGNESPWEWDQFTSVPILNKKLDMIRLRCIELDSPIPISTDKRKDLELIIRHLRDNF